MLALWNLHQEIIMTNLDKIIKRRTIRPAGDHTRRRLVVMLEPGDILAMREERRRTIVRGALSKIYWILVKWDAAERKRKAYEERATKRKGKA
jgi:hypothetical protein